MWYRIDINKFGLHLLPMLFRRTLLYSLLKVLLIPFKYLSNAFQAYRKEVEKKLMVNGIVINIEKALNDYFLLENHDIYITSAEDIHYDAYLTNRLPTVIFHSQSSQKPTYLRNAVSENQLMIIVNVPSYLGNRLDEVKDIIEYHKPAGRLYTIKLYEL